MFEELTFEVTQEDIDYGKPRMMGHCPIAISAHRHAREVWGIKHPNVFATHSRVVVGDWDEDKLYIYLLGKPERAFVRDFDANVGVLPFTLRLRLLEEKESVYR